MASADITIGITDEIAKNLKVIAEEVKAAKEALSEERIRAIVREELAAWEKRQRQTRGWTAMETK